MHSTTGSLPDGLEGLFSREIQNLYDSERRIARVLPKLIQSTSDIRLKRLLERQLTKLDSKLERLESIGETQDISYQDGTSSGMKGIIDEGEEILLDIAEDGVKDDAIITTVIKLKQYKMNGYGSAAAHARRLGLPDAAKLLTRTLLEERRVAVTLSGLARAPRHFS